MSHQNRISTVLYEGQTAKEWLAEIHDKADSAYSKMYHNGAPGSDMNTMVSARAALARAIKDLAIFEKLVDQLEQKD